MKSGNISSVKLFKSKRGDAAASSAKRSVLLAAMVCSLLICPGLETFGQSGVKGGTICGDAAKPECTKDDSIFKPFALVFNLSAKAAKNPDEFAAGEKSEYFYAVVLKTVNGYKEMGGCREITEAERGAAQEMFPNNKVFSWNYYCNPPNVGDKYVEYKFPGGTDQTHLLAVYGGATAKDAAQILAAAKRKYPKARLVRMQASIGEQLDV